MIGCGYQKPEGDKHPEVPVFPKHSNTKFTFTEIIEDFYPNETPSYSIQCSDDYWFLHINQKDRSKILVCDNNFKLLTEINDLKFDYGVSRVMLEDGTIYILPGNHDLRDKPLFKYAPPLFQKKEIKVLDVKPTRNEIYKQELAKREIEKLENVGIKDSLRRSLHKVTDSLYAIECEDLLELDKAKGYLEMRGLWYSIIRYKDQEEAAVIYPECQDVIRQLAKVDIKNGRIANKKKTADNLRQFDHAVIGNHSTGNHFVFGFHPYGYHYYQLFIGKDTTRFKSLNAFRQLKMEDGRVILSGKDNKILVVDFKE